jgi:predicted RNA-binding Zn-ribbon protein involved in translation (DUF1610 family)
VPTSSTTVERHSYDPCGGFLAWETTRNQRRYKCSNCGFNVKTITADFLEFTTKDDFKLRIGNEEIWNCHAKAYSPFTQLYICKLCGDHLYIRETLCQHFTDHTLEELFLSYLGSYVPE